MTKNAAAIVSHCIATNQKAWELLQKGWNGYPEEKIALLSDGIRVVDLKYN